MVTSSRELFEIKDAVIEENSSDELASEDLQPPDNEQQVALTRHNTAHDVIGATADDLNNQMKKGRVL